MTDTKLPRQVSASLAALKAAIMLEQCVLELDTPIARTRTDALLDETLRETVPARGPIVVISMEQALL